MGYAVEPFCEPEESHRELPPGEHPAALTGVGHHHEQMEAATALLGDSAFSEQVDRLVLHFGPYIAGPSGVGGAVRARMIIEEMLDELAENGMLAGHSRSPSLDSPRWQAAIIKILSKAFQCNPTTAMYALLTVWDEPLLDDITGHRNAAKFARQIGCSKAAVTKQVKEMQKFFGLPPRKGQRDEAACANMRNSRMKQLKTGKL